MKKKPTNKAKRNHKTFLVEMLPIHSTGAEIGVWTGKFTKQVLDIVQPKQYHLIDPWKFMPQYPNRWYGGSRAYSKTVPVRSQPDMDRIYNEVEREFGTIPCIHIHRIKASQAATKFAKASFDWVYIDGDHSYKEVRKDIQLYYPLIKSGGFLCGDDWSLPSVKRAVNELLRADHRIHSRNHQWWIKK